MDQITPDYVEKMIDAAGRDKVFAMAKTVGWTEGNPPPLWVWHQIALEILAMPWKQPT